MSKTLENLMTAFVGEAQANRKYVAFAKKADDDGYPQIAKLFRAAAAAETIHALNHFRTMGGVKSTAENVQEGIAGENYEVVSMYPPMLAEAEAAGDKLAARTFRWAVEAEKTHEALYRKAADMLAAGSDMPEGDYYVCPVCGYTHEGPMTEKCPVCGVAAEKFEKF